MIKSEFLHSLDAISVEALLRKEIAEDELEMLLRRIIASAAHVPAGEVARLRDENGECMFLELESDPPAKPEGFRAIVVFDMDNCLTHDAWRRDRIVPAVGQAGKMDFCAYHALSVHDKVNEAAKAMLLRRKEAGLQIAIITARPERWRGATLDWLEENGVPHDFLLMRPDGCTRPSAELKLVLAREEGILDDIVGAFDDRDDVIAAWREAGVMARKLIAGEEHDLKTEAQQDPVPEQALSTPDILEQCAATFRERNAVYGNNYKMVGPIMHILFPQGAPPELLGDHSFHLFELLVVKLSRLAVSGLTHRDSARDAAVYAAMIEANILEKESEK